MPPPSRLALALLASALPSLAAAAPAHYTFDPVHTRVLFAVSHAGFSQALGTVSGSHGELWFDPDDWSSAKLDVVVPLERVDMGDAKWTKAVLASNLLDAGDHPTASFASRRIEPKDATHARVCGDLTLRGVTRPLTLDARLHGAGANPMNKKQTVGFSATARLKRSDFNLGYAVPGVSDEVQLEITAAFEK